MISISFPIVFVIISVIFSQTTLSSHDQYEEASVLPVPVGAKIRKTFQNEYGDTYDCVDIYKQFSMTHPLLKNHKIQMRPSSIPKKVYIKDEHLNINGEELISKNTCPRGTVPIRRSLTQLKEQATTPPNLPSNFNNQNDYVSLFAGVTTKGIPTKNYLAVAGRMSLYNPKVSDDQMSGVIISVQSGGDRAFLNKVETGWMVNPSLYGDTHTRLYISWTADDGYTTGCYNTKCPGFIVTNRETPVDLVFNQTTVGEGNRWMLDLQIYQDKGNWWLLYGVHQTVIGYWPKEIVPGLEKGGQVVKIGGIVSSSSYESIPPMGSGFDFAKRFSYLNSAFFAQILFNNEDLIPFPGDNAFMETVTNRCYICTDNSYKDYTMTGYNFKFGYSFAFGGQGGSEHECY